jgi:molybdopterin-containing oxidoreductase family iron-sulfur binding subunit
MDRRDFLKLVGVASGTSILAGCNLDRKSEKLIPYLVPPEDGVVPGDATYSPSTCAECPAGCGVNVTIKDGRPTKLEGLPSHPVGDGALCLRGQASLERLYHPERIRRPLARDGNGNLVPTTWQQAYATIAESLESGGEHAYIAGRTTGTLSRLVDEFCDRLDVERLPEFELYSHAAVREANRQLFGRPVLPAYRFEKADFVLTLGADVLDTFVSPTEFIGRINRARENEHFNWYHAEPHATLTGLKATHRLSLRPGSEGFLLACLISEMRSRRIFTDRRLENHLSAVPEVSVEDAAANTGLLREDIEKTAHDFLSAHAPLVIAGGVSTRREGGLSVARMAALLQLAAGMIGEMVDVDRPIGYEGVGSLNDVAALGGRLDTGRIGVMFVSQTDPVSQLPPEFEFGERLAKAKLTVGIGGFLTGTMECCDIVLPASHALESWGDAQPGDGVVTSAQPAIEPLHDTRSPGDILLQIMASAGRALGAESYQAYLINRWRREFGDSGAEALLTRGYLVPQSRGGGRRVSPAARTGRYSLQSAGDGLTLVVSPSLRFFDGRSRVLDLLNEIPDPLTSVTWDKWVSVARATAGELGVKDGDWVEVSGGGWSAELPVKVQSGMQAGVLMMEEGTVPSPAGWDKATGEAGAVAGGIKVRRIRNKGHLSYLAGATKVETEGHIPLQHIPHHAHEEGGQREDITFYPLPDYPDYRWAMAIDLDRCTGCSACVAACYVENNVPVVGREEHLKGREMSWIAIQPYYGEDGTAEMMPVMCQHCDNAPCEPVCPVFATYHNDEGLNAQVYNRCVGTRYCANNCPYKVRRFNWFDNHHQPPPLDQLFNPDVSRRGKGIMEKCSFCVQRIRKARDVAKDEDRKIGADEVVPACAQTCPGNAIVFGSIKDENSQVARWARSDNSHQALEELGTGPAVYYVKRKVDGHDHG